MDVITYRFPSLIVTQHVMQSLRMVNNKKVNLIDLPDSSQLWRRLDTPLFNFWKFGEDQDVPAIRLQTDSPV